VLNRGFELQRQSLWSTDLFYEVDALLEIHSEVDELPLDSLLLVFLLLQDEHVVVEELLESLVGVVDTQLLEGVVLWDSNINTVLNCALLNYSVLNFAVLNCAVLKIICRVQGPVKL